MKSFFFLFVPGLLLLSGSSLAQFPAVMIGNLHAPEEVSICINPKKPNQISAGANLDNYYFSEDGGLHWTGRTLVSPANGVYGDPVLFADTTGAFYFMHLSNPPAGTGSWVDRIVCQRSVDGGQTYDNGSYLGLNGTKVQDKPWPAVNPFTNEIYVCWTQFDRYKSHLPGDSSTIRFAKSADQGATWSKPIRISQQAGDCEDSDSTVEGAVPCVGPAGQIYVAWAGPLGLAFNRSTDDGLHWLPKESVVDPFPGGWDYPVSGLYRCNGMPITGCDISKGSHRGTIYICWSDERNGKKDADIWMVHSVDEGLIWSAPLRVNADSSGNQNFMPWMTIDQANGDLYVVYYDRRNHPGSDSTDVFLARSTDGGQSFVDFKVNGKSFLPDPLVFFGDYINVSAQAGEVRPIWMQYNRAEGYSIWTALVEAALIEKKEKKQDAARSGN
jgi:hypothetical protein